MMRDIIKTEKYSFIAAGIIVFSILLMVITIPLTLINSSENIDSESSGIGISFAIINHLIVLGIYFKILWENKQSRYRDGGYVAIAILFMILALLYLDGAIAFVVSKETRLISILMFMSVLSDFTASVLMIIVYILKPRGKLKHT